MNPMFKVFDKGLKKELNVRGIGFSKKFVLIMVVADTKDGETTYAYDYLDRDKSTKDVLMRPWDQFEPRFDFAKMLKRQDLKEVSEE